MCVDHLFAQGHQSVITHYAFYMITEEDEYLRSQHKPGLYVTLWFVFARCARHTPKGTKVGQGYVVEGTTTIIWLAREWYAIVRDVYTTPPRVIEHEKCYNRPVLLVYT